jgi:hypothetical protein
MSVFSRVPQGRALMAVVALSGLLACGGGEGAEPEEGAPGGDEPGTDDPQDKPEPHEGLSVCDEDNGGCDEHARCESRGSMALCTCQAGYTGDGKRCVAAEGACAVDNGGCDAHAACSDNSGTTQCTCGEGYEGDGKVCLAVDACATGDDSCAENEMCVKTGPGTSRCDCAAGYYPDGDTCVAPGALCEPELTPAYDDIGEGCGAGSNLVLCAVDDDRCSSGVCVWDGANKDAYCSAPCDGTPETACPSGFECINQGCSGSPEYVCARIELFQGEDCMDMHQPSEVTAPNWFGATANGYEYSFVLKPYKSKNEFWARKLGEQEWTTALTIPYTPTGNVEGRMYEYTRLALGADVTLVAFDRGVFRLSGLTVERESLGDGSRQVAGIFRTAQGKIRAVFLESTGETVFYDRDDSGAWTRGKATPQYITQVGAFEQHGLIALCGQDEHLCVGESGDDLSDLTLPEGESVPSLKERKSLYFGVDPQDFMLISASGSVLRRTADGGFVRDALPVDFSQALSLTELGQSGFTRAGDELYMFLGHGQGTRTVIGGYRLDGDCWQPTNLPLSLVSYGAADGTLRYYLAENQLLCGWIPE